jgi:hypothetical protein
MRAPIAGGNPEIVETQQVFGGALGVTGTDVFWTASAPSGPSEIRAIQK